MKQNIRFRGLSFNKDEQSADHGELSLCAGVELHDGALRPSVLEGSKVENALKVGDNVATLLYVHETASYRHFIGADGGQVYWFEADGTPHTNVIHDFVSEKIVSINSVGNTLLVMTENTGIHYILWKDGNYKYLGTNFPLVEIDFRPGESQKASFDLSTITNDHSDTTADEAFRQMLVGAGDVFTINAGGDNELANVKNEENNDQRSAFTEAVWALVNQSNNTIAKDGHFYAPFLIRYCYRLYDGSMVMHSAPMLMNVSHSQSYRVYVLNIGKKIETKTEDRITHEPVGDPVYYGRSQPQIFSPGDAMKIIAESGHEYGGLTGTLLNYQPNNVGIDYMIPSACASELSSLKSDWKDIVKSLDIFVSPMMTREKSGELITTLHTEPSNICGIRQEKLIYSTTTRGFTTETIYANYKVIDRHSENMMVDFPMLTETEFLNKLKDTSTFFLLKSVDLSSDTSFVANDTYSSLSYEKSIVPNITSQELMNDDYHTHNQLIPLEDNRGMYVYNHRVNLYGMKEKLFGGIPIGSMANHFEAVHSNGGWRYESVPNPGDFYRIEKVVVEIETDDGVKCVENTDGYVCAAFSLCNSLFFYPDSRAKKMTLFFNGTVIFPTPRKAVVLKLEPHNFLNGAVSTELYGKTQWSEVTFIDHPSYTVKDVLPMPNKILTSDVDNPYYFPIEGRNTVGIGSIIGIAAVTRALSQGQVGDHDLVVFSTDGIWVLKVSSTGTYMSSHNISREVCSNPRSICQLDQSIIFATQRSLSKFVESDVASISDVLDGPIPDLANMLPGLDVSGDLATLLSFGTPAVELFNNGRVFYDYASSRIEVLQQDTSNPSVALVFSIRDMAWSSMMVPGILSVIPGYPSPYVQTTDGKVMVLNKQYGYSGGTRHDGLIITRTLTFSDTMDIIRGFRQLTDSAQMPVLYFYGSNNQRDWRLIGKTGREFYEYMPGHPYRFFRVAIKMSLLPSEEYQQLELEIISKYAKL